MRTRPAICRRKRRYADEGAAVAAALAAGAERGVTLRVYRCALCRHYHLTSRTKGMRVLGSGLRPAAGQPPRAGAEAPLTRMLARRHPRAYV